MRLAYRPARLFSQHIGADVLVAILEEGGLPTIAARRRMVRQTGDDDLSPNSGTPDDADFQGASLLAPESV